MTLANSLRTRSYDNKHAIRQRDKARREGRTLLEVNVTYEAHRAVSNQGRWPEGSVFLWACEEVWSSAKK
jgi:hypothetical protein